MAGRRHPVVAGRDTKQLGAVPRLHRFSLRRRPPLERRQNMASNRIGRINEEIQRELVT